MTATKEDITAALIDKHGDIVKHSLNSNELIEREQTRGNRDKLGQWKPGQSPNPNGRPKGSRNALSEAFVRDMHALWMDRGNQALMDMLVESPTKFCQLVGAIIPKDFQVSVDDGAIQYVINAQPQLSIDQWADQYLPQATDNTEDTSE